MISLGVLSPSAQQQAAGKIQGETQILQLLLKPAGELRVTTPAGEVVSTTGVAIGSVYGGNTTSVRVALPGQLPLGDYLVTLNLTDEATGATASISDAPVTLAEPDETETFAVGQA